MFNPQQEKIKIFTRRSVVLTGAKYALLSTLGSRLYYLQVKEGKKYNTLSEGNRIKLIPVIPRRPQLEYILDTKQLIVGEEILTSGDGGIFSGVQQFHSG